jgi:transcriptional regulator of acetoin/glycerol metabolism
MFTKTVTAPDAARGASGRDRGGSAAGIVLLYAPDYRRLPSAFVIEGTVIVGREPDASDLCLPSHTVSREHARFSRHNRTWLVTDLSSRNGTFVNGRRVASSQLSEGDQIRIGDAIFKFVADRAEEYAAFPIDGGATASHPSEGPGEGGADLKGGLQMQRVLELVKRVAPTSLSVLVHGETGTGKELVARAIHVSSRRSGKLCAINCAAMPSGLIESELFGVKRGAFTGATTDRLGVIRSAHGGTLMLDEVGDMPAETQAKLLRVLETREVVPLGAVVPQVVDVRVVSATHFDLRRLVEEDKFRGDLFARINGCIIELLPLRARKEDIFQLVRHFAACAGRAGAPMSFPFMEALLIYDWPFNVRELEAAIRHAVAMAGGEELDLDHLPEAVVKSFRSTYGPGGAAVLDRGPASMGSLPPPRSSKSPDADELRAMLVRHRGNVAAVARELGKDRAQVHRWVRYARINLADFR